MNAFDKILRKEMMINDKVEAFTMPVLSPDEQMEVDNLMSVVMERYRDFDDYDDIELKAVINEFGLIEVYLRKKCYDATIRAGRWVLEAKKFKDSIFG